MTSSLLSSQLSLPKVSLAELAHWARLGFKLLLQSPIVGGLVALLGFLAFQVLVDLVIKPGMEKLNSLESAIQDSRKAQQTRQEASRKLVALQTQLKDLPTRISQLEANQSPKVLAASLSSQVMALAQSSSTPTDPAVLGSDPESPLAWRQRQVSDLKPEGVAIIDVMQVPQIAQQAGGSQGEPAGGSAPPHLNVWKFDYTLKVSGSYAALADLVNQIVVMPQLVTIQRVELAPSSAASSAAPAAGPIPGGVGPLPAPASVLPVEMLLKFSVYVDDPAIQGREPGPVNDGAITL